MPYISWLAALGLQRLRTLGSGAKKLTV
jgi:hypothetical protein